MGSQRASGRYKNRKALILSFLFLPSLLFSENFDEKTAEQAWQLSSYFRDFSLPAAHEPQKRRIWKLDRLDSIYAGWTKKKFKYYAISPEYTVGHADHPDFSAFSAVCHHRSAIRPLVSTVTGSEEDNQIVRRLLECIYYEIGDPFLVEFLTMEVLSKVLAYRDCDEGALFAIPVKDEKGEFTIAHFVIERKFDLGGGFPAYGLVPLGKKYPPFLIYRGSEFALNAKGIQSLRANLDLKGPGYNFYLRSQPMIRKWLEEKAQVYPKARVSGFSLGGTLAAYTILFDGDLINTDPKYSSYAFNMPGFLKKQMQRWHEMGRDAHPFKVYINQGDLVSKVGFLVGQVNHIALPFPLKPVRAHNFLILGQPLFYLSELDMKKEQETPRLF